MVVRFRDARSAGENGISHEPGRDASHEEYTERRQLNNEGFSLIELLIAIVILSIIVVPLLHSFVTSARTNAKSRNTMHATAIAEDVMEQFEAHTLEEMADTYEAATPTGFTNSVQKDASLDVDGDGAQKMVSGDIPSGMRRRLPASMMW